MKVLKFGAVWCVGCNVMRPRWKEIEEENPWLETQYFDYDEEKEAVEKYKVGNQIPVFIFLDKQGNEITRLLGEVEKDEILEAINTHKDK